MPFSSLRLTFAFLLVLLLHIRFIIYPFSLSCAISLFFLFHLKLSLFHLFTFSLTLLYLLTSFFLFFNLYNILQLLISNSRIQQNRINGDDTAASASSFRRQGTILFLVFELLFKDKLKLYIYSTQKTKTMKI